MGYICVQNEHPGTRRLSTHAFSLPGMVYVPPYLCHAAAAAIRRRGKPQHDAGGGDRADQQVHEGAVLPRRSLHQQGASNIHVCIKHTAIPVPITIPGILEVKDGWGGAVWVERHT